MASPIDALKNLNWHNPWLIGGVVVAGALVAFVVVPKLKGSGSTGKQGAASGPAESTAQQTGGPGEEITIYVEDDDRAGPPQPSPHPHPGPPQPSPHPHPGPPQPSPMPGSRGRPIPPQPSPGGGRGDPHGPPQPSPGGGRGDPHGPPQPSPGGGRGDPHGPPQAPPPQPQRFVHPQAWPGSQSTLSGIAQAHGVSTQRLEAFPENAYIANRPGGYNRIYTSDTIRIA